MALRTRNAVVLAKIEATEGQDAVPIPGTDAILVENPQPNFNPNVIETDEVTASLDGAGPIVGGMTAELTFDVLLKGSGAAASVPEFGDLIKACGWAETITGTAIPAAPEAVGTGSTNTAVVLGTSASSIDQVYRGMPLDLTGAPAALAFISDYVGGTKMAGITDLLGSAPTAGGTQYQIPANVLYAPASTSIPSLTLYLYLDGILYKLAGCRGSFNLSLNSGGIGRLSFTFQGMFLSKEDAVVPAAAYDATRPPAFKGGAMLVDRKAAALENLSLDVGNEQTFPDNPNAAEGFDPSIITRRNVTGSINPLETLIATRDIMADFRAGTQRIVHARYGGTAGNRVGVTVPGALYTGQTPGDRSGLATVEVPFSAVGRDAGAFLCFY